ncbi:hypothetical protein ACS0TY_015576 [Phlomoides rotata]
MPDDKKNKNKNRNKKNNNRQATKPTESVTVDATESTSDSQSQVQEAGNGNDDQVSVIVDATKDDIAHTNADRDEHFANDNGVTNSAEAEKQYWLDREATFEDKIKELQAEKDAQIQKEALLEEKIKQLSKDKDENSEKEASLKEKLKQLQDEKDVSMQNEASQKEKLIQLEYEKDALIQKEGSLEQKLQQLQREIDVHLQKEACLESKILQLEGEKDSWIKKEGDFEAKINQFVDEAALLNLKMVSLEQKIKQMERERDSWILKENVANESVASLTSDNTKLQAQVIELEQSRESLLNEKRQLEETISILQSRINNLEIDNKVTSEHGDTKYNVEDANALVDKLIFENSELVEKMSELYAMLDQRGGKTEQSFSVGSDLGAVTAQFTDIANGPDLTSDLAIGDPHASGSISEVNKTIPISESTQSLEELMVNDQRNRELVNIADDLGVSNSSEIIEADEIVQIPLDENEVKETNSEVAQNDEEIDVSLVDSPLIGAPFRLISFFASYVSGADLVNKSTGK